MRNGRCHLRLFLQDRNTLAADSSFKIAITVRHGRECVIAGAISAKGYSTKLRHRHSGVRYRQSRLVDARTIDHPGQIQIDHCAAPSARCRLRGPWRRSMPSNSHRTNSRGVCCVSARPTDRIDDSPVGLEVPSASDAIQTQMRRTARTAAQRSLNRSMASSTRCCGDYGDCCRSPHMLGARGRASLKLTARRSAAATAAATSTPRSG